MLMRLEDGRRLGNALEDVWLEDATEILDPDSEIRRHLLLYARGWGKTSITAAITACVMLTQLPAGARAYGAGADRDQARLMGDALAGFCQRTEELQGAITVDNWK